MGLCDTHPYSHRCALCVLRAPLCVWIAVWHYIFRLLFNLFLLSWFVSEEVIHVLFTAHRSLIQNLKKEINSQTAKWTVHANRRVLWMVVRCCRPVPSPGNNYKNASKALLNKIGKCAVWARQHAIAQCPFAIRIWKFEQFFNVLSLIPCIIPFPEYLKWK